MGTPLFCESLFSIFCGNCLGKILKILGLNLSVLKIKELSQRFELSSRLRPTAGRRAPFRVLRSKFNIRTKVGREPQGLKALVFVGSWRHG